MLEIIYLRLCRSFGKLPIKISKVPIRVICYESVNYRKVMVVGPKVLPVLRCFGALGNIYI